MYCSSSSPTLINCMFLGNRAGDWDQSSGGAVSCWGRSSPTFRNCTFLGNTAQRGGGGIGFYGASTSTVTHCTFTGNSAALVGGGAIECSSTAAPTFINNTFYGNAAPTGGGIRCKDATHPKLTGTILVFCTQGEAIHCADRSTATLSCCTIYGNAGGDWVGCIEAQAEARGNRCLDPLFVDPENHDFRLREASPCASSSGCGLVGAWLVRED